jgi:hypothetical protein
MNTGSPLTDAQIDLTTPIEYVSSVGGTLELAARRRRTARLLARKRL